MSKQALLDKACCEYAAWRGGDPESSIGGPTLRSYVSNVFRAHVIHHALPGFKTPRLKTLLGHFAIHMARTVLPSASSAAVRGRKHPVELTALARWIGTTRGTPRQHAARVAGAVSFFTAARLGEITRADANDKQRGLARGFMVVSCASDGAITSIELMLGPNKSRDKRTLLLSAV